MAADPLTSHTVDNLLFDDGGYISGEDPFTDKPVQNAERDDKPTLSPRKRKADGDDIFGRDLDEEVKITKQRKKIPKLDAERLLSDPGLPKIRKLIRSGDFERKLRLKGKGHEFSDTARLLSFYQLWLDQLYPRAKFADAIKLVEKAGHTKKLQMYRKSWIDEGKPGHIRREDADRNIDEQEARQRASPLSHQSARAQDDNLQAEDPASLFLGRDRHETEEADGPDDDELDALLAQGDAPDYNARPEKPARNIASEPEDDLGTPFARPDVATLVCPTTSRIENDLHAQQPSDRPQSQPIQAEPDELGDDSDDLDALLAAQDAYPEPDLPSIPPIEELPTSVQAGIKVQPIPGSEEVPELVNVISSSPIPNVRTDELDQLMDEHDATVQKQKQTDPELVEEFMSSSPIPNRESQ